MDSVVAAHRLSCSAPCGILVPLLGIELEFPALQGRFFFFLKENLFGYLCKFTYFLKKICLAVPGLSFGMWNLQ